MIYFDNAATTGKKPYEVTEAVGRALKSYSVNPGRGGYAASLKTAEAVFDVRQKVALFFGAKAPENVIFTHNCTHSLNYVIKGVLGKGDHVVVSSFEHNAVMRPLKKSGNPYTVAKVSLTDDDETLENFKKSVVPNTKLVICTGASNVSGKILPIAKIGEFCRENGLLFAVDAAQIAGVIPIDTEKMNIDFLCIAPHKGLYAPMGTGILIANREIPNTVIEGGTGTNSLELYQPEDIPEKFESGTLNVPGIFGIGAGINFVRKSGMKKIYSHEMKLTRILYSGLVKNSEVSLYTPFPNDYDYAPVLSFNYGNFTSGETASLLSKNGFAVRGGYHCAPSAHETLGTVERGLVRVSFSAFNTENEVYSLVRLLLDAKIFKKM